MYLHQSDIEVKDAISPRHAAALAYARAGIPVFPCVAGGKRPATPHGFHDATTNEETINGWWSEADYNVAVEPERAGWAVIDIDRLEVPPQLAELATGSRVVRTPRGGWHIYLAGSLPPTAGKLGPGIDTRGRDSYVLVPPSIVDGRPYLGAAEPPAPWDVMPLPEWIAAAVEQDRPARALASDVPLDLPDNIERARTRLRHYVGMGDVAIEGQGGDDRTYRLAAEMLNLGLSEATALDLIATEWNPHCLPPWDHEELATKVANAAAYMQNEPGSWAVGGNTERMAEAAAKYAAANENEAELFSTGRAQRLRDPKPVAELIPGLVEKHCVTYLSGPGGSHKSRIAQEWGARVHTGTPVYGRPVERATFVYVSYENGADEDARRQATLIRRLDLDPSALDDHVYCGWKGRGPLLEIDDSGEIFPTPLWQALDRKLQAIPGHKFVVFDSAYNVFLFKGNAKINETAVQRAIDWLDNGMAAADATGLMLMHPSTAGIARGDNSGWSVAWVNRPRARLTLKPEGTACVTLGIAKRNNAPPGGTVNLHWSDGLMVPDYEVDQQRSLYAACVEVAIAASNGGVPLTLSCRSGAVISGACDQVETICGVRPTPKEMREHLHAATLRGHLIYRGYDKSKRGEQARAGFFPGPKSLHEAPAEPF